MSKPKAERGLSSRDDTLYTVMHTNTAHVVSRMLAVLFPDVSTVLDVTYGDGGFWSGTVDVDVTGTDLREGAAPNGIADFRQLPYPDNSFDLGAFDPPYHTNPGKGRPSVMSGKYGSYPNVRELRIAVQAGCTEIRRVSRIGAIIKVQDHIRAAHVLYMTEMVREAFGGMLPYETVILTRAHKIIDGKWNPATQLSAYRNCAVFMAYRWGSQEHARRRPAPRRQRVPSVQRVRTPCPRCGLAMSLQRGVYVCRHCVSLPGFDSGDGMI